jgi:hypothetical protein
MRKIAMTKHRTLTVPQQKLHAFRYLLEIATYLDAAQEINPRNASACNNFLKKFERQDTSSWFSTGKIYIDLTIKNRWLSDENTEKLEKYSQYLTDGLDRDTIRELRMTFYASANDLHEQLIERLN